MSVGGKGGADGWLTGQGASGQVGGAGMHLPPSMFFGAEGEWAFGAEEEDDDLIVQSLKMPSAGSGIEGQASMQGDPVTGRRGSHADYSDTTPGTHTTGDREGVKQQRRRRSVNWVNSTDDVDRLFQVDIAQMPSSTARAKRYIEAFEELEERAFGPKIHNMSLPGKRRKHREHHTQDNHGKGTSPEELYAKQT